MLIEETGSALYDLWMDRVVPFAVHREVTPVVTDLLAEIEKFDAVYGGLDSDDDE